MVRIWLLAAAVALMGLKAHAAIELQAISFDQIASWQAQPEQAQALEAFVVSCKRGIKPQGEIARHISLQAWRKACKLAANYSPSQSRQFFETHFVPHRVNVQNSSKLTGYYIPLLEASLTRQGNYQYPLYAVPDDFKQPYYSRSDINNGALEGKNLEIVWLKDPIMRFFLHVQGSGHLKLPNGRIITAQFAAKNGLQYQSIGKLLVNEGHLSLKTVSLQSIRAYLRAHPERQREVFNHNPSYIFFSLDHAGEMPKGAQAVPLTPMHSLAIDPAYWPYGLPIFLQPMGLLTISQDTGSAIKGPTRADLFVGLGDEAEAIAGHLNSAQNWIVLLPKP